jgi:hypothetical protein
VNQPVAVQLSITFTESNRQMLLRAPDPVPDANLRIGPAVPKSKTELETGEGATG